MTLFDDFSKKVGSFAQTTVQKSKELAEITKINFQISGEEDKIKKTYIEIGKIYFEENAASATGRTAELCNQINASMDVIKDLREKINEAKNIVLCPNCGKEVDNSNKFCNGCGAKMPVVESAAEVADENKATCKACGADMQEGSPFCQNCGTKAN